MKVVIEIKCTIEIDIRFNVGDIVKIKNDNNDKYMTLKILNMDVIMGNDIGTISTTDNFILINHAIIEPIKKIMPYSVQYNCITISPSWYNNEQATKIKHHFTLPYFENELLYRQIKTKEKEKRDADKNNK